MEFMLAGLVSIYKNTSGSTAYQEQLTEYLSGTIDEIAGFIEATQNDETDEASVLLRESRYLSTRNEIESCTQEIFSLLEERIK